MKPPEQPDHPTKETNQATKPTTNNLQNPGNRTQYRPTDLTVKWQWRVMRASQNCSLIGPESVHCHSICCCLSICPDLNLQLLSDAARESECAGVLVIVLVLHGYSCCVVSYKYTSTCIWVLQFTCRWMSWWLLKRSILQKQVCTETNCDEILTLQDLWWYCFSPSSCLPLRVVMHCSVWFRISDRIIQFSQTQTWVIQEQSS